MANLIAQCDLALGVCVTVRKPVWTLSTCCPHAECFCEVILILKCKFQVAHRNLIDLCYNKVVELLFSCVISL